ncbi:MAG TPA: hypothetical protein VG819_00420 [Rhizomicrobium sp.]|jgi:hypothetical protein|nr:hypothetical protein [Rhizomicrobium sp.]
MPRNNVAREPGLDGLTPSETARYTEELLESLRKIAVRQGQSLLAQMLALAKLEAHAQAGAQAQDTRFPE